MVADKAQIMETILVPKDFGQYRSVVPISWRTHRFKDLESCVYDRYFDIYGVHSISITYNRRKKSHNLDEIEDLVSPPKWAFEREKLRYLDFLNQKEPDVTSLTVEKVATQNDIGILLRRMYDGNAYSYEFREWFRYYTPPLAQILLVVIGPDSQGEVESWRDWFVGKIVGSTNVEWDPLSSLGPFRAI